MRKPLRIRHFLSIVTIASCSVVSAQNVGINATTGVPPTPNANAILDIDVTGLAGTTAQPKRGLLIPRMTSAQRLAIPVGAGDNGLLVYQTDTGAVYLPSNQRGFWYYSTTAPIGWTHLAVARSGWSTNGNVVGSNPSFPEFLGTVNLSPNRNLIFRTVLAPANPAMQMGWALFDYKAGFVGLGTAAPAVERLEVNGAIRLEKNATPPSHITPPTEGAIRYGTIDGTPSSAANLNWHWGTDADSLGNIRWSRLENAEELMAAKNFLKDTVACAGATGDAMRGFLSPAPVTQTTNTPANIYSPFATNFGPTAFEGSYRVQYLYRYSELVQAGLCFPATINAFSFYCLDQENQGTPGPPVVNATTISGEVRMGAATNATLADLTSGAFGTLPGGPFMDDVIRGSVVRGSFSSFTPSPGWITFTMTTPLTLPANNNLIIDIVWSRNASGGVGPKVELENPGFNCTKWLLKTSIGAGTQSPITRGIMDDNLISPSGSVVGPAPNAHNQRPVTRFTGTVITPTVVTRSAEYLKYEGGLMIGSVAWLATAPFHGAGAVNAQKGVYDGGTLLSDHVFDRYFDGAPRPEEAHATQGYAYVGLDELRQRLEKDRHLPNMPSRTEWEAKGGASLGTITTGLWETVEDQALYITQLEKDLTALEEMAFGKDLAPQETQRLITEVQGSKRLSEAQKIHLIDALNEKALPGTQKP